ncbi:site-specific DNA-methyltransferase [soil metagenome]
MAKKKSAVEAFKHKDTRTNIPTEELRDFVAENERVPSILRYPRDSSLDPQLVWNGKDLQDGNDLAVPVVPIYIQEKIHPQAIISQLTKDLDAAYQLELFSDFNGGPKDFDQKVDFYHHQQNWTNRLILGDSLLVATSLAEKEGLKGKVQCVFLDPPYGIKFGSNWQVSTRKRDVKDGKAEDATRQPEQVRAFRDTWKLGVHSYLSYLRDRFAVTRELLTESGSIFVQIGDENVHLVRSVLDEVFGSENFVALIAFNKTTGAGSPAIGTLTLASICDFVLWYAKDSGAIKYRQIYSEKNEGFDPGGKYSYVEEPDGKRRRAKDSDISPDSKVRFYRLDNLTSQASPAVPFTFEGKEYIGGWKTNEVGLQKLVLANRIIASTNSLNYVRFIDDFAAVPLNNAWMDVGGIQSRFDPKVYVVQTATKVVQRCLLMTTDPGDLVFDPTCGSGTTAYVAEQWGRRWITCDTSRVALALARTRLMCAKFPYYLLSDSPEGIKKETDLRINRKEQSTGNDIRKGFVYKRVPHVTLKSIANNLDIKVGMTREQINKSIAKNADSESLYDKPYEDDDRVRISGPFSVESLSPHRVLSTADDNMDGTTTEEEARKYQDFATMILENLKKAGVQNTRKSERLIFDSIEPYPGQWIHAVGEYADGDEKIRKAAISIGPEHGTVGPDYVKEAAKEAVQGVGFDLLIICGFAFDPHVTEEAKRYGKLVVLPTKMNPDLAMGNELLKKTGAGNLFMIFGEPDVDIEEQKDGQVIVKIKGLDVYDPTTGQVRSSSTADIACWFIDTDYNGESFFVRHAYFTGAGEPYVNLKRALRAEIDETVWTSVYSNVSRPFKRSSKGKIAVKVINHYGDEVMKVFDN